MLRVCSETGEKLYREIDRHLQSDDAPSYYLAETAALPQFAAYPFSMLLELQSTEQSPVHHPEGNVWNHTLMVVDQAAKVKDKSADPRAFMWAALLHDIGKPSTTKSRNGKITSYSHDTVGAELARAFLSAFNESPDFTDRVAALVKYHMQILFVVNRMRFQDIKGIKRESDTGEVALLGLCDRLGRKGAHRPFEEEQIKLFVQRCEEEK